MAGSRCKWSANLFRRFMSCVQRMRVRVRAAVDSGSQRCDATAAADSSTDLENAHQQFDGAGVYAGVNHCGERPRGHVV